MRRGDAIGTRHSSLTVGNAADRDDSSQSWHRPTACPLLGSPTGLPPRSPSCSPPRAHKQQTRWRGGQRAEGGGLSGKAAIRTEASSCTDAAGPHLLSAWCSRQRTRARRPGFSLPCAPPSRGSREKGGWLTPRSARTRAGSHLAPRKGQFPAPLQAHPTLPAPCFPGYLRRVPRSGASASCPGLPAVSV